MKNEMFIFRKNALLGKLCKEWDNMWKACGTDKEKLVRLSLQQQSIPYFATYCYEGKGLTKDYIKDTFGIYINGVKHWGCDSVKGYSYRLFVDYNENIGEYSDVTSIMWCYIPSLFIAKYKCPVIYVSNKSTVHVSCEAYNHIRVYLFDVSEVIIDDLDEESVVIVYKYSDNCNVTKGKYCLGRVNEFTKTLRL